MKAHIKNFQSVEDVELELNGLTVLVGKSNIGKSAVRRAIQGALTNLEGEAFVTHGASNSEVHLSCPELELTWKKGGGFNDYTFPRDSEDSRELVNVGRGAPPAIAAAGFRELETSRGSVGVQIADQFHPLFLLQEHGSTAAEAISDVGRLGEVQAALKSCEKDRRSNKAKRKIRKEDHAECLATLETFKTLEDSVASVVEVTERVAAVQQLEEEIRVLEQLEVRNKQLQARLEALAGVGDIILPEVKVESLAQDVKTLQGLVARRTRTGKVYKALKGVDTVVIPEEIPSGLQEDVVTLARLTLRKSRAEQARQKWEGADLVLIPEAPPVDLLDTQRKLGEMSVTLANVTGEIPKLKSEVIEINKMIEQSDVELHQVLHEAGKCPVCDQDVL